MMAIPPVSRKRKIRDVFLAKINSGVSTFREDKALIVITKPKSPIKNPSGTVRYTGAQESVGVKLLK